MRGKFFLIDKHSQFAEGQIVFRYMPIVKSDTTKNKWFPKYPIYLVIKPFAIDFYYHRPGETSVSENEILTDLHTCIIHLPLSLNLAVKDNLSKILNDIYFESEKIPEGYVFNLDNFKNAYWDTFNFAEDLKKNIDKRNNGRLYFKYLLLDFIYDLEHTSIFQASPYYEEAEVHLKENFVFSAITTKAAYYYNRQNYFKNNVYKNSESILVKKLAESEIQWLNILRNENALVNLEAQNWFDTLEKEYNEVLFSTTFPRTAWVDTMSQNTNGRYSEKNKKILKESARWFLRRYNFVKGYQAIFQFYHNKLIWITLLALLSFLVFPIIFYTKTAQSIDKIENVIFFLFYVFLGIIPFILTSSVVLRRMFLPILSALIPRLMMAIASAWLIFSTTEELVKTSFDVRLFDENKIWVFLLIIPVCAFMSVEIKNMAPDVGPWSLIKRMFALLYIGFIYSLLIGMFFINSLTETMLVRSGYLEEFYNSEVTFPAKETHSKNRFTYLGSLCFDQMTNASDKKKYEELRNVTYDEICGIKMPDYLRFKLRYDIPIITDVSLLENFQIFPGMLIYRAIFALFMGIFIQLIFEEKPITEPL